MNWKIDASDLMAGGKYQIPEQAKVFSRHGDAQRAAKPFAIELTRVWQVPGGWAVINRHLEVMGKQRGSRPKTWYALIHTQSKA